MTITIKFAPSSDSQLLQLRAPFSQLGCIIVSDDQSTQLVDILISPSSTAGDYERNVSQPSGNDNNLLIRSGYDDKWHPNRLPSNYVDLAEIILIGLRPKINMEISAVPAVLDEIFESDYESLRTFVNTMREANHSDLLALTTCAEQSLWDELASVAHRLKGATTLVHCMTIGNICSLLHASAKKKRGAESRALCWLVEHAIAPLQQALSDDGSHETPGRRHS